MAQYPFEPFRTKMIEPIRVTTRAERLKILTEAGFNPFQIRSSDILIDFLTDSGTTAMSDNQWAAMITGDEAYAGAESYFHLKEAVEHVFGLPYFVPVHQGRAAEAILCDLLVKPGAVIPSNAHFDSTEHNIALRGAHPVNLPVEGALDPERLMPFKGDIDLPKLAALLVEAGPDSIPFIIINVTSNTVAGQPVSMANLRETKRLAERHGVPLFLDAARYAENAYFIKLREPGYSDKTPLEIAREMFSYADGFVMSAKKDGLVNIGGLLGTRDGELYDAVRESMVLREGFYTYGGLAGRDLEALALGLREGIEESYLEHRIGQVGYLGDRLKEVGIPIFEPPGGHAIFLDATRFLPHVPPEQFPGMALAAWLYMEVGVRALELGSLAGGSVDPISGKWQYPTLQLVRLAVPRRVYTQKHLDFVVEGLSRIYEARGHISGLKLTNDPRIMRHSLARLAPIDPNTWGLGLWADVDRAVQSGNPT